MRTAFRIAAVLVAVSIGQAGRAEEFIAGGEDRFKFMAGGVLARIDSSIGINGTFSTGTEIDLETPGLGKTAENFILGGQWRVGSRHRLTGYYFTTRQNRSLSFDRTITIGDDTLVPPTTLASEARNRFLFATYQYSVIRNKDIELAGVIGAYVNKFTIDFSGSATVQNVSNGVPTTVTRSVSYRPGVTVPLPLVGGSIDWFVTPRFSLGAGLSGMKARIGDVDGRVFVATATGEYMFTRNLGVGVSFMHANLDVDVTKPRFNGKLNWQNDNLVGYMLLKF